MEIDKPELTNAVRFFVQHNESHRAEVVLRFQNESDALDAAYLLDESGVTNVVEMEWYDSLGNCHEI